MNRRDFVIGSTSFLAANTIAARTTFSYTRCQPAPMGPVCEVGIDPGRFPLTYAPQRVSQWCWAASISMIFSFHGYSVPQEAIVQAVYGQIVNLPAMSGAAISSQLNRTWMDTSGKRFTSTIRGLFDADAGIAMLNNQQIINTLSAEQPLLLGNLSHAVVLTAVAYGSGPVGPNIFNIGVLDPWPGIGMRGAQSPTELIPMHMGGALRYLALPEVRPA